MFGELQGLSVQRIWGSLQNGVFQSLVHSILGVFHKLYGKAIYKTCSHILVYHISIMLNF